LLRRYISDTLQDQTVRERLSWYYDVLRDLRPSKFLICKEVACEHDPGLMTETQLWREHGGLRLEFLNRLREFREGEILSERSQKPQFSFLDVKVELLNRILRKCVFCEWRCKVDRIEGEREGACHLGSTARVATFFRHFGEEPPLVDCHGSGTIFFTSCTFRCLFCHARPRRMLHQTHSRLDSRKLPTGSSQRNESIQARTSRSYNVAINSEQDTTVSNAFGQMLVF